MKTSFYLSAILFVLVFSGCTESEPRPKSMIGIYHVDLSLDESIIKGDIFSGLKQAKKGIQKGIEDLEKEWTYKNMPDTTTIEGKLEYTAKEFGKNMTKLGSEITEMLTTDENSFNTSSGGLPLSLNFDAELAEDGKVRIKSVIYRSILSQDYQWSVVNDSLYLYKESKDTVKLAIRDKTNKGFILENQSLRIQCQKIDN